MTATTENSRHYIIRFMTTVTNTYHQPLCMNTHIYQIKPKIKYEKQIIKFIYIQYKIYFYKIVHHNPSLIFFLN